ncbi:MAG: orotidine-5'-phosphate decarboxylase [Prevotellaceae bacterium]|jgi:orotidine-5'-phosphate decarboxylase|nr:orotidine-5'-phosphate decarboxylase [Prevotellaceae bacterium]
MTAKEIFEQIKRKRSFLCTGLDTDIGKLPECLLSEQDPAYSFNKAIIDATVNYTVAYKPNIAFYESNGEKGWISLGKTLAYIRDNYPGVFIIADAKRGDIGNTSEMYAKTFFETFDFDAVTLSPYMGKDTVEPFMKFHDKWSVLLALTSNPSAGDFQYMEDGKGIHLFERVLEISKSWGNVDNTMYVVGATKAEMLAKIRSIVPDHFLLVPGIGAQGGSLNEVAKYGMNSMCGLLVNSSRAILYADKTENFADAASNEAERIQQEMSAILSANGFINPVKITFEGAKSKKMQSKQ